MARGEPLAMSEARLPAHFRACWGPTLLARPLFVAEAEMCRAEDDLAAVFDALSSLPGLLGVEGYLRALGLDPPRAGILAPLLRGAPDRYGRADLYHDGEALRLLEFNIAADAGGPDYPLLNEALMRDPAFAAFAGEFGLAYRDTREALVAALSNAAEAIGRGPDPHCLILCGPGGASVDAAFIASLSEMLEARGLRTSVAEPDAVVIDERGVSAGAGGVDVIFRYFNLHDLVPTQPPWWNRLMAAVAARKVALWTGADSAAYSNKASLALLRDPDVVAQLPARQRAAIERLIPPCWRLGGEEPSRDRELSAFARDHREDLVLKGVHGYGGKDVLIGEETSVARWQRALTLPRPGGWLLQRRIAARPELVWDAARRRLDAWRAVYGLFLTPKAAGGGFARAMPINAGGVVNFGSSTLSRTAPIFTYGG